MLRLPIENTLDREEKTMAEWQTVRLGEIVNTEPIEQLEADLESLRNTQDILQQTQCKSCK